MEMKEMKIKKSLLTILVAAGILVAGPLQAGGDVDRVPEARSLVKKYFGNLKTELVTALKSGGPVEAITVCNSVAPFISESMGKESGWSVERTSLKLRNPKNAPDQWETAVLQQFEARKKSGENLAKMEFSEITEKDGTKVFRYMKAIPTAKKPCLACHGAKVKPAVEASLKELYPEDKARGYKAGDIRGAFTLTKNIE